MTRSLLILHEKCNKPADESEWVQWHLDTHEPDVVAATGASHVTFWQLAQKPQPGMPGLGFSHVTILEFDDEHPRLPPPDGGPDPLAGLSPVSQALKGNVELSLTARLRAG